jgi:hypothetical protein
MATAHDDVVVGTPLRSTLKAVSDLAALNNADLRAMSTLCDRDLTLVPNANGTWFPASAEEYEPCDHDEEDEGE